MVPDRRRRYDWPVASYVLDEGGENDNRSIPLATKQGNWIRNVRKPEHLPGRLRSAAKALCGAFPNIRLRSLSATYNCVGMVFAARRTWVEPEEIDLIRRDDEYIRVERPVVGDLVVYRRSADGGICHIGQVVEIERDVQTAHHRATVLSQWGQDGEYLHDIADVPELYGSQREFWTERRNP